MERSLRPKTDKDFGAPPPGYIAGRGRGATGFSSGVSRDIRGKPEPERETDLGDSGYDKFTGYSESLFQSGTYDRDDDEADRIYDMIESRMESRKKKSRIQREQDEIQRVQADLPDLQSQFNDIKGDLQRVSEEEWMQLPVAQERLKVKKTQKESYTNVPDSLLVNSKPPGMPGSSVTEVGEAKKAVLSVSLGETTGMGIDADKYLSELSSRESSVADIAEVKKARLLFKSITKSDPNNPTGWLAAARLEEVAGDLREAKTMLARGLANCPTAEDLWLAAIKLEQNKEKTKALIANAIKQIPKSAGLWEAAAEMEERVEMKIRVFQKSLEIIPNSVILWKNLINLSSGRSEILLLLGRAVECCPSSEELWLKYAQLSEGREAQKILNDARRALPSSVAVWVSAIELAESMGADDTVLDNIVGKAVDSLKSHGVVKSTHEWLETAARSMKSRSSSAIARFTIRNWILSSLNSQDPKTVKHELFADNEYVMSNLKDCGNKETVAQTVLETAVKETPLRERKGVWIKFFQFFLSNPSFEKSHIPELFQSAVEACPHSEVLWLMFAKHVWQDLHRVDRARDILRRAMDALPESEDIYIAAARIEESPKHILTIARSQCPKSSRIWIKAAQVERFEKNTDEVVSVCRDALGRVSHKASDAFKLAIIPIHALLEVGRLEEAADLAGRACEVFSRSPAVWLVAADVAMQLGDLNKARSVLERARIRLPTDENLWWKGFFVEERSYGLSSPAVKAFLSRALQACPSSGLLWTCAIESEPAVTRHPKCLDALKKCPNDGLVVSAVAKLFWLEKRQIDKARKWYQNAVSLGARLGQVWSDFLAFEIAQGDDNAFNIEVMIAQIKALDPQRVNMGIEWNMYRKSMENWKKTLIELVVGFVMIRFPGVLSNMTPRVDEVLNRELADITKQE